MVNVFFTQSQLNNLSKWKYSVEDRSITTEWFTPFWDFLVKLVPDNVAPNVLSLAGLLCIIYSFILTHNYLEAHPTLVPLVVFFLGSAYMNLDAIDGKHARRTKNASPLGELFDHACDNIGVVFMTMTLCLICGIQNPIFLWYIVQCAQIVFLESHVMAYRDKVVKFERYSGPGEILLLYLGMVYFVSIFGTSFFEFLVQLPVKIFGISSETLYLNILICAHSFLLCHLLGYIAHGINSYATKYGLFISLFIRTVPLIFGTDHLTTYGTMANGLVMAVLTGDMIVAKMANRDLHQLVPVFMMLSLFCDTLCMVVCAIYYIMIFYEISTGLNIPIFSLRTNVYANGVYDLFHEGHMRMLQKAASYGSHLIVGIHSDETVANYKRMPIMTEDERYTAVGLFGCVNEIVKNADLYITEEFIKEHNINIVVCSPEYDSINDKYYAVPRRLGILRVLPRTEGISTSELIKRIKERDDTKSKQVF